MSIVNFAISKPLETQVNSAIKDYGFHSKAEFFRFLAINFVHKNKFLSFEDDTDIKHLSSEIVKAKKNKYSGKKMSSTREQLADL